MPSSPPLKPRNDLPMPPAEPQRHPDEPDMEGSAPPYPDDDTDSLGPRVAAMVEFLGDIGLLSDDDDEDDVLMSMMRSMDEHSPSARRPRRALH